MTHVSSFKLKKDQFDELYNKLNIIVGDLTPKQSKSFFDELLGTEEKIMLVKRLGAIAMFQEGHSSYRVAQALHLSPSTAERLKLKFKNGYYQKIINILTKNHNSYEKFWSTLELILNAGLPPRGRGRWEKVLKSIKTN